MENIVHANWAYSREHFKSAEELMQGMYKRTKKGTKATWVTSDNRFALFPKVDKISKKLVWWWGVGPKAEKPLKSAVATSKTGLPESFKSRREAVDVLYMVFADIIKTDPAKVSFKRDSQMYIRFPNSPVVVKGKAGEWQVEVKLQSAKQFGLWDAKVYLTVKKALESLLDRMFEAQKHVTFGNFRNSFQELYTWATLKHVASPDWDKMAEMASLWDELQNLQACEKDLQARIKNVKEAQTTAKNKLQKLQKFQNIKQKQSV